MYLLHNIGPRVNSNYNTREEIQACSGPLSFDGIYRNVFENRDLLRPGTFLFVMGNYVGKDNSFDIGQPLSFYCTWTELRTLCDLGCKLGWHTWSHPNLTLISDERLEYELTPPPFFPLDYFAYPYGNFDDRVIQAVQKAGWKEAWTAGNQGDDSQYQRRRQYLNW